jgi:hypothetical protein
VAVERRVEGVYALCRLPILHRELVINSLEIR